MQISAVQVPSLHRVAPKYLKLITSSNFLVIHANIYTGVAHAVGQDLGLFCADFHSTCLCSVYKSVSEVLKFTIVSTHKINVVSE